jgi:alkylation response protein AidB-like acyl-CoA dehydrogenase
MNYFDDNADLRFHVEQGLPWERIVPLWEPGFADTDGPRSVQEAAEGYRESLATLGQYAAREIAPRARAIDEQGVGFADGRLIQPQGLHDNLSGLRRLGVMAPSLPRALGGANFPYSVSAAGLELLARACSNTMILYAFHQAPALLLLRFGSPEQIARWVPALASGAVSGSVAMTEAEAGSDLGRMRSQAREFDGAWRLDGSKQFITNAGGDISIVLARTEPGSQGLHGLSLLLVPRELAGQANFSVAAPERKHTIRGSATCTLHFEGARAELLGTRGAGFRHMLTFMNEARVAVALQGLGVAEAALRKAQTYAQQRVQSGQPIARHPMVADRLLDMQAEIAALRALVYRCTALQDELAGLEGHGARPGVRATGAVATRLRRALRERTPLVKWLGSERPLVLARQALQVHGGYGVMQDYEVERHWRDAVILPIYEGTSQIQALMALKDQMRWGLERPWQLLAGRLPVSAPPDLLGDGVRELADESGRALRCLAQRGLGLTGAWAARRGRLASGPGSRIEEALLHAEHLTEMLAWTRAAEALAAHASTSSFHRRACARLLERVVPHVRGLGELVRTRDMQSLREVHG